MKKNTAWCTVAEEPPVENDGGNDYSYKQLKPHQDGKQLLGIQTTSRWQTFTGNSNHIKMANIYREFKPHQDGKHLQGIQITPRWQTTRLNLNVSQMTVTMLVLFTEPPKPDF